MIRPRCGQAERRVAVTLILVTGISGVGKSTVREELARRGFAAFDTDEDEIAQWTHKVTGRITPLIAEAHRTPEFLASNEWRAEPERVRDLADENAGQNVFLCGAIGNEAEVWPLFDTVFCLSIDEVTLRHRLATRSTHNFGTKPHELELLLAWHEVIDDHYRGRGAIMIDASRSPEHIADEILHALDGSS
jgi:adenylate kinase family enzyme